MIAITRAASIAAILSFAAAASSAFAAGMMTAPANGRDERRTPPSFGPRASIGAAVRSWVAEPMPELHRTGCRSVGPCSDDMASWVDGPQRPA